MPRHPPHPDKTMPYCEILKSYGSNRPGDRVGLTDAEYKAIGEDGARIIPDEEAEAIREEAKVRREGVQEKGKRFFVELKVRRGRNYPGDKIEVTPQEAEAERLFSDKKARMIEVRGDKSDSEKRAEIQRASRREELGAYDYHDLRSVAADVSDEVGGEPASRGREDLTDFLLDNYSTYKRVSAGDD